MDPALLAVVFGLSSAATYGAGDFMGGFATKKSASYTVVFSSQIFGTLLFIVMAFLTNDKLPQDTDIIKALIGGVFGCIGVNALYRGLAISRMSLVATVSAVVAAILPVMFSMFTEGIPPFIAFVGFALALAAVWLISSGGNIGNFKVQELFLPVLAGTCFAFVFILISESTKTSTYFPLIALRTSSLLLMLIITKLNHQPYFPQRDQILLVAACGVLDALGNIFFALAAQNGRLDIAVILTALYPAGTVFLAAIVIKEHINRVQWIGVVLALAAIICLSL